MTATTAKKKAAPAKKATSKKEVAKQELYPAEIADMIMEDSGAGQENMGADDFAIPRLVILQKTSPEVDKQDEKYMEDAEPYMILENVNRTLYDGEEGIVVVPITYRKTIIEWDANKRGNFIADHGYDIKLLEACKKDEKGRLINEAGNSMVTTAEYFVFVITEDGWEPAVISMSSTQIKKSKRWNSLIDSVRAPHPKGGKFKPAMFFMSYHLTTVLESNDKGTWGGWQIIKNGPVTDLKEGKDIYLAARDFHDQVKRGDVRVADPVSETGDDVETEDSPM